MVIKWADMYRVATAASGRKLEKEINEQQPLFINRLQVQRKTSFRNFLKSK